MTVTSIEEAKELLYGHPVASFVSERNALTKELRTAGNRDLAAQVKALRKPSAVAAEVNRVARANPSGVELILQAADLLRSAQAGSDITSTTSELQQQYRAAIQALAQSAKTRKAEVRAALEAATIDLDSNSDLRIGALAVIPRPVSIFDTAPTSPVVSSPTPAAEPVDELAERRARKKAKAETAAQKAEQKQRRDEERKQKKLAEQRRLKREQLRTEHAEALQTRLDAIEAEATAQAAVEAAESDLTNLDEHLRSLEQSLAEARANKAEAITELAATEQQRSHALDHLGVASTQVAELAQQLAELDD